MRITPKKLSIFSPKNLLLHKARKIADQIDSLKEIYRSKTDLELLEMTEIFLDEIKKGKTLDDIVIDALATIREMSFRIHGIFAYKVQLVGAIIVHFGDLAEMFTGEGKTLVIILVSYLNALSKKGVHIVTVNEYLVQRDAEFSAQVMSKLGITVGYNIAQMNKDVKKEMFARDITYTTNSELGFDYLRDNMVRRYDEKVIRSLSYAIVDEADSILIDEARTPLIISGQPKKDVSMYIDVDLFVKTLKLEDYKIEPESNSINLSLQGIKKVEERFKLSNLFSIENSDLIHKIKNAMTANFVFINGKEYIVRENKIMLVDYFTGRVLEGRSYNAGLHQAIQAKESVKIEPENVIVATVTYQSFFRLYSKLAGVSGTAITESDEFLKIYNMVVVAIPTNKTVRREDFPDFVFTNKKSKWNHVVHEVERINKTGQPILIGTASVEDSEELAYFLRNKGLKYELLNAKNHAREAEIVKGAGLLGAITLSTNMAGRGTDIKLGPGVVELGGLFVMGTERHESRRIDNQLKGRSGRQGDPGQSRFFISLQDSLFQRFAVDKSDKANDKLDEEYFDSWFFSKLLNSTQKKVEGMNYDMRKHLIDYDTVLSNQRELVYKQRDQILKNFDNTPIMKNMAKHVAYDIVNLFKSESNLNYIDSEKLVESLNSKLFNAKLLKPEFFKGLTIVESEKLLYKIICESIQERAKNLGPEQTNIVFKDILLQNLDTAWTNHLDIMSKIREGVTLRSLEQKSPLNIYVNDGDNNFYKMKKNVAHQAIIVIHRIFMPKINEMLYQTLIDKKIIPNVENKNFNLNNSPNLSFSNSPSFTFSTTSVPGGSGQSQTFTVNQEASKNGNEGGIQLTISAAEPSKDTDKVKTSLAEIVEQAKKKAEFQKKEQADLAAQKNTKE